MASPAQNLFMALRAHSHVLSGVPGPDGGYERWKDGINEIMAVAKAAGLNLWSPHGDNWLSDATIFLGDDRLCDISWGPGGSKTLRCDGQEHTTVAQLQRQIFIMLIEASEGIKRARRGKVRTIARCRQCSRVLCEVEVLLNPAPLGKIAQISNVRCQHCNSDSSITIEVREAEA